jgi:hypothetical protein
MKTSMKTKSMYLAALFMISAAVTAFSNDEPGKKGFVVVSVPGAEIFKVVYKGETTSKVKLNIYNAKSEMVFSEAIGYTEGFILPLNFSGLAFGEYRLELIDAKGKRNELISYQPAKTLDNIRITKISKGEGKFVVSVINAVNEKVTVKIYDNYDNLVHNEVKDIAGDFAQVYTVKNLYGACTFEVSDNKGNVKTAKF